MIESAGEFERLCAENDARATHDEAPLPVWREVVARLPDLRVAVALNKTVPVAILELLSDVPDPRVRTFVAMKRTLTPELQERLAGDPDEGVRQRVALNAKAARSVLERLARDPSPLVAQAARARLEGAA